MSDNDKHGSPSLGVDAGEGRALRRHDRREDEQIERFAIEAARTCSDLHCENVIVFDVRGLSDLTDYIVIASGTSDRQIKSIAGDLTELGRDHGFERFGSERDDSSRWVVIDFVDVIVHLFEPATRAHYDIEMLWGDAPTISWRR